MSVDPEPRQRTVAELLAENGGPQSGRRRRRRAADDEDGPVAAGPQDDGRSAPPPAPPYGGAGAPPVRRPEADGPPVNGRFGGAYPPEPQGPPHGYEPNGRGRNGHGANGYEPNGYGANGYGAGYEPAGFGRDAFAAPPARAMPDRDEPVQPGPNGVPGPPPSPPRGWAAAPGQAPPGQAPPRRGPEPSPPRGMPASPGPAGYPAAEPESPTGAFGARAPAPGADVAYGGPPPDVEGGPPTQLGAPPLDDDALDEFDERAWTGELADEPKPIDATAPRRGTAPSDGGPPTQAGFAPDDLDDHDELDEYEDHGEVDAGVVDDPDEFRRGRRRARGAAVAGLDDDEELPEDLQDGKAAGTGQAWAMVIAQWVGGAIVGAGVWVGFRYLWFSLPVVALSLAVVLTVGLVLGVRALLRNDDLRTTMFAVLVGLLLTVSPALLVLLDR